MELLLTTIPIELVGLVAMSMGVAALVHRRAQPRAGFGATSVAFMHTDPPVAAPLVSVPDARVRTSVKGAQSRRSQRPPIRRRDRARRSLSAVRRIVSNGYRSGAAAGRDLDARQAPLSVNAAGIRPVGSARMLDVPVPPRQEPEATATHPRLVDSTEHRLARSAQFDVLDRQVRAWVDGVGRIETLQDTVRRKVDSVDYVLGKLRDELADVLPEAFQQPRQVAIVAVAGHPAPRRTERRRDRVVGLAAARTRSGGAFAAA